MSTDKYGVKDDPYCYPGTNVLKNRLNIRDPEELQTAELTHTASASDAIEFEPPPYDFDYLRGLHRQLFSSLYEWAGEPRQVDIAKDDTRFCNVRRIEPEARRCFVQLEQQQWLEGLSRSDMITQAAELYGNLNMVHPFREGNGRALRLLFEHIIINCGFEIDWTPVDRDEWLQANIDAVTCDYRKLAQILETCVGDSISG